MEGWLFDVYPSGKNEMTVWFMDDKGSLQMFKESYYPEFYVYSSSSKLEKLKQELESREVVRECEFVKKRVRLKDFSKSKTLSIRSESVYELAEEIIQSGRYRDYNLFNVDVPHDQTYLHKLGLFPLARCEFRDPFNPELKLLDSSHSLDYEVPPLKYAKLKVKSTSSSGPSSFNNPIENISICIKDEEISIDISHEGEMILKLVNLIKNFDPDVILTEGGDSWDFPYLVRRAEVNEILDRFYLGRENQPFENKKRKGTSFHSYGRVYYKPPSHHLRGRIHIDTKNSFIYRECGMQGLIELSRVTRTPLQKTARSSIGSAMTNLQLYWAHNNNVLIPWKKSEVEEFKSGLKLLEADKGGFIYQPKTGIHENVGEIDFSSFYPALMEKYNISPETVLCECCPDSENKVPEIGYNICEKRRGFIPQILEPIINKREDYKQISGEKYDRRQEALKWILVTCFGYLGYRKARFGRIEAHESVTAFARENLKKASRIAEDRDFEIIHGIVDSLWVKKRNMKKSDLCFLCSAIEKGLGLSISPEGKYKWLVFPFSKESKQRSVVNRYYGVFENGDLKVRGLAVRRNDTPELLAKAQKKMLEKLAEATNVSEFKNNIPDALKILKKYAGRIEKNLASPDELAITKRLSRDPTSYENNSRSAVAAKQLLESGIELRAGQKVRYVVTDSSAQNPELRVRPLSLLKGKNYDKEWYLDSLLGTAEEILNPFSYNKSQIRENVLRNGEQSFLRCDN